MNYQKFFKGPKSGNILPHTKINEYFELLDDCSLLTDVKSKVDICRDPKDNFLLALAIDSDANYIISGDNDLLTLKSFASAKIISYREFEAIFSKTK